MFSGQDWARSARAIDASAMGGKRLDPLGIGGRLGASWIGGRLGPWGVGDHRGGGASRPTDCEEKSRPALPSRVEQLYHLRRVGIPGHSGLR